MSKNRQAVPIADFAASIEKRRRDTDVMEVPRNDGTRRSDSKKMLLAAIKEAGGNW